VDGVVVRPATVAEAPAIARIHWDSWVATYAGVFPQQAFDEFSLARRERLWAQEAALNADATQRRLVLAALHGARVLGFASVGPYRVQSFDEPESAEDGELRALYLDPTVQRHGVGRLLWTAAAQRLRAMGFAALRLWVIGGNPAVAFYCAMGARPVCSSTFDTHGVSLREDCYRAALS
jgi:GNAT superfamily N-acetyltransferase